MQKIFLSIDQEGINAEALQKEAEFIVNLGQHENVIHVYGYCIEEKCKTGQKTTRDRGQPIDIKLRLSGVSKIVMEYAELGDLHRHLRKLRSVGLDDAKQFAFAQQIAEGMNYVVSKGVRTIRRVHAEFDYGGILSIVRSSRSGSA